MPTTDLTYLGNCHWEVSGEREPKSPPNDVPTFREPWLGRSDELAAWLAAHAVGSSYGGGYIVDNTPRDNTPFPGMAIADLIVMLPPDYDDYLATDSEATKTATKSATVSSSTIIPGETEVKGERNVTFISPQTNYTYFKATRPTAARFAAPLTSAAPVVVKSVMKASANSKERTFPGAVAPAALVSALAMSTVNIGTKPEATPIPGTPWFRCSETWSRELEGD